MDINLPHSPHVETFSSTSSTTYPSLDKARYCPSTGQSIGAFVVGGGVSVVGGAGVVPTTMKNKWFLWQPILIIKILLFNPKIISF